MRRLMLCAALFLAWVVPAQGACADMPFGRFIVTADTAIRIDRIVSVAHADAFLPAGEKADDGYIIVWATMRNFANLRVSPPTYLFSFDLTDGRSFGGRYETDVLGPYSASGQLRALDDAPNTLAAHESRAVRYVVLNWPKTPIAAMSVHTSIGVNVRGARVGQMLPDYTASDVPLGKYFPLGDVQLRIDQLTSHRSAQRDPILRHASNQDRVNGYFVMTASLRNPFSGRTVRVPAYSPSLDFNDSAGTQSQAFGPYGQDGRKPAIAALGPGAYATVSWLITNWVDEAPVVRLSINPVWKLRLATRTAARS